MGQKESKFISYVGKESDIILQDVKLEIKQSTVQNGGNGVFAGEFIKQGTIFCRSVINDCDETSISGKINDLGYTGSAEEYETNLEQTESKVNIKYINPKDKFDLCFQPTVTYISALVDIQEGEELSRHYGVDYWYCYEFDKKYGKELPTPVYDFFDELRENITQNICWYLYEKYVDGKYFYVISSHGVPKNFYRKTNKFSNLPIIKNDIAIINEYVSKEEPFLVDVSKNDNSELTNEPIIFENRKLYMTEYLQDKLHQTCLMDN